MPGPGLGAGIGTLADDGDDRFLAELARDFLQSGTSLELPASLGDFGSFPSPGLDHPKQARPRRGACVDGLEHAVCRRTRIEGALQTCYAPLMCLAVSHP